jgi:hypothetical protein
MQSPKGAAVALANKMTRITWKLVIIGGNYAAKAASAASAGRLEISQTQGATQLQPC